MKTTKLISMTDFVITEDTNPDRFGVSLSESFGVCCNYARFLKQPLTLSMFVPCDDEGNVLLGKPLSPAEDSEWIRWEKEQNSFFAAREKVIFKGFKYSPKGGLQEVYNKKLDCGYIFGAMTGGTIESLANKGVVLSETALKQIYG